MKKPEIPYGVDNLVVQCQCCGTWCKPNEQINNLCMNCATAMDAERFHGAEYYE